jgi:hypothetical protein
MLPEWDINFLILEPGRIKTEYCETSTSSVKRHPANAGPEYPTSKLLAYLESAEARTHWGETADTARAVFNLVSSRGERGLPLRLLMGSDAHTMIAARLEALAQELAERETESDAISKLAQAERINFLTKD